jgi:hypothetical protein
MASPFKKKSPLNAYKYSLTSQYANPRAVIQPIVEAEAAKAIGQTSKRVLGELSKNYEDKKLANKISEERLSMSNKSRLEKSAAKPAREATSKLEYDMNKPSDKSFKNLGRTTTNPRTSNTVTDTSKKAVRRRGKNVGFISNQESSGETKERSMAMMKGSPNKLIEDTMNPNPPVIFPTNQAQNDLDTQPIISADSSQPSARDIDVSATLNPYTSPGADFNPSSKIKAQDIFGSPMRRQGLMNVGSPAHDKGHPNDYEGHTHRKKGGSYKEGDYMDETDMETSYPELLGDSGEIKRDKKSQFMVSKNEDYNPTKIDTIRPLKGKEFKMGWGDAERNVSTNPKYKKSK